MTESRRLPRVAHLDEYDSDQSSVKPGTRVEARRQASVAIPSKTAERQQRPGPPDAASDSGYSSQTSAIAVGNGNAPPQIPTNSQPSLSMRSKPIIHRSDSLQNGQRGLPVRSASVSRPQASHCSDPKCGNKECLSFRNAERRFTMRSQPQAHPPQQSYPQQLYPTQYPGQNPAPPPQYQQMPPHQYGQPIAAQPMPTANPQPQATRPRNISTSHARPMSWGGGAYGLPPSYPYGSTPPQGHFPSAANGLPPSPSNYQNAQQTQYALYYQQQALASLQLGSTPPTNSAGIYPPPSPGGAGPSTTSAASGSGHPPDYSTRRVSGSYHNYEAPSAPAPQPRPISGQTFSARTIVPGSFAGEAAVSDEDPESETSSSSCSSYSDDSEHERRERRKRCERRTSHHEHRDSHHRHEHGRRREIEYVRDRDRELMPPPQMARRPSLKTAKTTPAISAHSSRDPLRRAPRSDTRIEYVSPPEHPDSDRRSRHTTDRYAATHSSTNSRHSSRGPSVFTNSSSGRTPATDYSNEPKPARYIVEDPYGQRRAYASREEAEQTARRLQQRQRKLEEDVLAYQSGVSGSQSPELTLDNIKRSQHKESKPSGSNVSGSSKKSASSSKLSKTDTSFQIKTGDTVFQVTGDAKIELRQTEDGGQMFTIGSASGREGKYYASSFRSSGSRMGRSRQGSVMGRRRDTIHEEDGYEPGF